jgi:hypothetical protein
MGKFLSVIVDEKVEAIRRYTGLAHVLSCDPVHEPQGVLVADACLKSGFQFPFSTEGIWLVFVSQKVDSKLINSELHLS